MLDAWLFITVLVCRKRDVYKELTEDVSVLVELDTRVMVIRLPEEIRVCRMVVRKTVEVTSSVAVCTTK